MSSATPDGLAGRVHGLLDEAVAMVDGTALAPRIDEIRARLDGPLRVAIAGRVKAGKSTLLNALVGERLAPTDAGECTRIVSWYREGLGFGVQAHLRDGTSRTLTFSREGGMLDVRLGELDADEVDRLEVTWPSSTLHEMTLIDTPGLGSIEGYEASLRTMDVLAPDDQPGRADAVLYLVRHLHRRDAQFLEAFTDRSLANASPVNAIAVLSRADEIGAGRPDALDSAARIADRYRRDERVKRLCVTVLPMAGLLAETGQTLREREFADLRTLAAEPHGVVEDLLISADRFVQPGVSALDVETRAGLIERLGVYGVRFAVTAIREGRVATGPALSAALVDASGLPALTELLHGHFTARSRALKARSALAALRDVARRLEAADPAAAGRLAGAVERLEASADELAELRLVHLVLAGAATLADEEVDEVLRLTGGGPPAARVGLEPEASGRATADAALGAVQRWRERATDPFASPADVEVCDLVARAYEGIYARTLDSA